MERVRTRNTFDFIKGRSKGGQDLAIMDYALPCKGEECDIYAMCPYNGGYEKCQIHKRYMAHIIKTIYRYDNEGKLTDHQLHVIGMTMVPLYNHLFRFQIAEMALSTPILYGKQVYMHPVYKEIRNTTKLLFDMWKGMGMVEKMPVPERGTGGSVYDIISNIESSEEEAAKSLEAQVGKSVEVEDGKEDDTDEDEIGEEILEQVTPKPTKKEKARLGRKLKPDIERLYDKMEEAANGFTVEGPDGEEGIVLPAGFDPRKLPNASEIDYSNEKTPSEVEAMKERFK